MRLNILTYWLVVVLLTTSLTGCTENNQTSHSQNKAAIPTPAEVAQSKIQIAATLDSLNSAAASANFMAYFSHFTDSTVFAGTDATERWSKRDFMAYAKPHFDKGRAWTFNALERHITLNNSGQIAWFDELLRTQMKICRGSGVVVKQGNRWLIDQYILSITMPNGQIDKAIELKAPTEDTLLGHYK